MVFICKRQKPTLVTKKGRCCFGMVPCNPRVPRETWRETTLRKWSVAKGAWDPEPGHDKPGQGIPAAAAES